jgi:hypothetical protein
MTELNNTKDLTYEESCRWMLGELEGIERSWRKAVDGAVARGDLKERSPEKKRLFGEAVERRRAELNPQVKGKPNE